MNKLRIIVGGMVGQFPLGGVAWDYFHYVLGLAELGHDVVYHEDTGAWPGDPNSGGGQLLGAPYTRDFIQNFFDDYAPHLADRWHYVLCNETHLGMSAEAFADVARSADIFLNVSGACRIPQELGQHCRKVFMDTDPGYNQIKLHNQPDTAWARDVYAHDKFLTYAENIYAPDCNVPRLGIDWKTTRCVVTLSPWKQFVDQPTPPEAKFTTVMGYDWYDPPLDYDGVRYEHKVPEFERFYDIHRLSPVPLRLAVGGSKTPVDKIRADGWDIVEGRPASITPAKYLNFIGNSLGEWSIAKNVYAATNSGWFSCRTACYLAAGRPAVVQETGWSRHVPAGAGVFAFSTMDEAVSRLAEAAHPEQRAKAYEIAREYLAPDRVLPSMLAAIG